MNIVKKIFGIVGIILGALGILLAIAAIAAVWVVNTPITDGALDLLDIADGALITVDDVLVRADDGLQEVRTFVSDTAEAIPGTELAQRVDNLLVLVESAAEAADSANTVVGLANKTSGIFRRDDPDAEERPIAKLSATLDNLAVRLVEIDQKAKDLKERNVVGEIATQIDSEIAGVQDGLSDINTTAGEAQVVVTDLKVAVPRWIDTISIILTLIFIWMGVAQLALAAYGLQWVKGPSDQKAIETEQPPALVEEIEKPAEPAMEDLAPAAAAAAVAMSDEPESIGKTDLQDDIEPVTDEEE